MRLRAVCAGSLHVLTHLGHESSGDAFTVATYGQTAMQGR